MSVSFRTRLLVSHAAVAMSVAVLGLILLERNVARQMEDQVDRRLRAQAEAVATWLGRAGHPERLAVRLSAVVGARVTFIDKAGNVVGESDPEALSEDEATATEVRAVREGRIGRSTRAAGDRQPLRFVAVPAADDAIVRLGVPIGDIAEAKSEMRRILVLGAGVATLLALLLATLLARAMTTRLRETTEMARRLGEGDWNIDPSDDRDDELGVLAKTLQNAAADLRRADEQRRELLTNIAHEIRTPVTSIQGFSETLSSGSVPEETRSEFLHTIHRNSLRIGKLVGDMLELESLEAGGSRSLDIASVALSPVLKRAAETLRLKAKSAGSHIEVEVDDDISVLGDDEAIERIALNLIHNAVNHAGDGITVAVSAELDGSNVAITFADTGSGIDQADQDRIFDRLFRGQGTRSGEGSGLGLAIARRLAQRMNGTLELARSTAQGTTLVLKLPAALS